MTTNVPLIMLVEDNESDAELFRWALQRTRPNTSFLWFRDGDEVLNYLYRKEDFPLLTETPLPSFIFLDLKLMRIHGLELLQRIQQDEQMKHIPVFIWTSNPPEEDASGKREGIAGYLLKQKNIVEFKQELEQIFQQYAEPKQE